MSVRLFLRLPETVEVACVMCCAIGVECGVDFWQASGRDGTVDGRETELNGGWEVLRRARVGCRCDHENIRRAVINDKNSRREVARLGDGCRIYSRQCARCP